MYSPKISEENVRLLYRLRVLRKTHMTTLVNEILRVALINCPEYRTISGQPSTQPDEKLKAA